MSALRKHLDGDAVYPEDFEDLQRIFNEVCAERPIDPHSEEAEHLAERIIAIFQQGFTDEDEIRDRLTYRATIRR
jgi:hypothetical protein